MAGQAKARHTPRPAAAAAGHAAPGGRGGLPAGRRGGPAGLSMRKLATALHVSLPTVYTAVDSRETLIGELQDRLVTEIATGVAVDGPITVEAPDGPRRRRGD